MENTAQQTRPIGTEHAWPATPVRSGWWPRLVGATAYSLLALPMGVVAFVVAVTGVATGVPLVIVWVGLPVLAGTLLVARGLAHLERLQQRALLGEAAPTPAYRTADGAVARVLTTLRDPQTWLDLGWGVVAFATGTVSFVVTVTWWAAAAGGLTYWFWQRWLPVDDADAGGLAELLGLGSGRVAESWLNLVIGVLAALSLPFVVRSAAALHAAPARLMLSGRARHPR